MFATVESIGGPTTIWDCVEAPREHGKSTVRSISAPMWATLTKRKSYVVIVTDTITVSRAYLSSIKKRLESDPDIRAAWGVQDQSTARVWRTNQIELADGQIIAALSKGQSVRGLLEDGRRPDLIIIDDPQKNKHVKSAEQRKADWKWLTEELLPAGQKKTCDVLFSATRLHGDCLSARIAERAQSASEGKRKSRWTHSLRKAIENGKALHPGMYSLEELAVMKADMPPSAWAKEYLNNPRDDEDALIQENWLVWEKCPEALPVERYLFMDPAKGRKDGDYTAVVELLVSRAPRYIKEEKEGNGRSRVANPRAASTEKKPHPHYGCAWVNRVWLQRKSYHQGGIQMLKWAGDANGWPRPRLVGFEPDQYGAIANDLKEIELETQTHMKLKAVSHSTNKIERIIAGLQGPIERGRLRFNPNFKLGMGDVDGALFMEQLLDMPSSSHDDGPDALEGAWSLATAPRPGIH